MIRDDQNTKYRGKQYKKEGNNRAGGEAQIGGKRYDKDGGRKNISGGNTGR